MSMGSSQQDPHMNDPQSIEKIMVFCKMPKSEDHRPDSGEPAEGVNVNFEYSSELILSFI